MKKRIMNEIEIPQEVEVEIKSGFIKVNGKEGKTEKKFKINNLVFEKKDNKILIGNEKATKNEKKRINSITAHVKNMIKGVQEKFEYKLKIVSSHFPITVEVKGKKATIKNFLGEKIPRYVELLDNVDVKIEKDIIDIKSVDRELAGQTAANFETATRIRLRDRRIFQDGIFMITKAGRKI